MRNRITLALLLVLAPRAAAQDAPAAADSAAATPYRGRLIGLPYVSYTPQTKLQIGVAGGYQFKWPGQALDVATRPSYLAANFAYTTKKQWLTFLGTSLFTPRSDWWVTASIDAGFFPLFYYGVGPRTEEADSNLMEHRFLRIEGRVLRRLRGQLYVGPSLRRHTASHVDWQFPAAIPAGLPGGKGGVTAGAGASVLVDGRNSQTTPTHGYYLQADLLWHDHFLGGDYRYGRVVLDARTYLPVRSGRDVIALSAYAEFNGKEAPIQSMALLSNSNTQELMRGVYLGRFRDRHELVTQADYRGHLKGRLGYVVFGAAGNVFGSPGSDLLDEVKFTYGAGLRFNVNPADPLNLRVDYTLTSFGGGGISIGATEAF
ncbi:MAG: hypothetical protein U0104_04200 [Gemmatimonadales bacterium]